MENKSLFSSTKFPNTRNLTKNTINRKTTILYTSEFFKKRLNSENYIGNKQDKLRLIENNLRQAQHSSAIIIELPESKFEIYKIALLVKRLGICYRVIAVCAPKQSPNIKSLQHIDKLFRSVLSFEEMKALPEHLKQSKLT